MGYKQAIIDFQTMDLNEMRPNGFLEMILERQKTNIRSVNDKNGWIKREHCPVCSSEEKQYEFSKYEFNLYQCTHCGTAFFDRIPANPDDVYSSDSATEDAKISYLGNKDYRKIRFARERVQLIEGFTQKPIHAQEILDVGCGTGWFLEYALEKGATCYGVELGTSLSKHTSEHLGIPVWNCELTELDIKQRFDVITMFDLIEHVISPVELIKSAKKMLKPDGIILVFTPQYDSVAIQEMKEYSNLIMPAEHLSYFTKTTVEKLTELTNMELVYYVTKGIDIGDLKSFYDYRMDVEKATVMNKMYDVLQPSIDQAGTGNHMRFIIKGNES